VKNIDTKVIQYSFSKHKLKNWFFFVIKTLHSNVEDNETLKVHYPASINLQLWLAIVNCLITQVHDKTWQVLLVKVRPPDAR
jgi:hypothetical protein